MGYRGQPRLGTVTGGEGKGKGQGKGGGEAPQLDVQAVRCYPPGIHQMPAHHASHHHQPIYNMDPDMGALILRLPPQPPRQPPPCLHGDASHHSAPAAREPPAEPAQMAAAPAARGSSAEPARMAQEPQAESARGASGAPRPTEARNEWVRDPRPPLGGKALPLVLEVYGWLSWATSGTTRGLRNGPSMPCSSGGMGKTGKYPRGGWWPGGTQQDPPGRDSERDGPTRSLAGRLSWRGGRCSVSPTRRPMSGCPEPCAPPSATGATARGTRRRRSSGPRKTEEQVTAKLKAMTPAAKGAGSKLPEV